MTRKNTAQDFYNRLKPNANGCLEYIGRTTRGYGRINWKNKAVYTHRLAYELKHGFIPQGMHVCHTCDNPLCCNTNHLFLGTHADNMKDMCLKNRQSSRLTEKDVLAIRSSILPIKELSKQYNISIQHTYDIISKRKWKHI